MLRLEANLDEYKLKAMSGGDPMATITVKARVDTKRQGIALLRLLGQPVTITIEGRQMEMFPEMDEPTEDDQEPLDEDPIPAFVAGDRVA
ncbi:MAG: hypothetical protein C4551_10255 [Bacillota bacterium]|jgi:hypothetical protein|nr:MAG: hypothetical protein C4551_10255 [Bacillota bacterium]